MDGFYQLELVPNSFEEVVGETFFHNENFVFRCLNVFVLRSIPKNYFKKILVFWNFERLKKFRRQSDLTSPLLVIKTGIGNRPSKFLKLKSLK